MVRKNLRLFLSSVTSRNSRLCRSMLIVAFGSSSTDWQQVASLATNADEFPGAKPTNEPARLWVETYGAKPRDWGQLVRLGRRYLADQVAEGRALGLQVGAWLARGPVRRPWPTPANVSRCSGPSSPPSWPARRCEIASWAAPWPTSRPACRPRSPL